MLKRILIANRGEIAVRIIRTCREMGIETIAIYSDVDAAGLHVQLADRAVRVGPAPAAQSYLNIDAVIDAALRSEAQAIHPGYGFLAENPQLARRAQDAGLAFIGPSSEALEVAGDKIRARRTVEKVGVPIIPAVESPSTDTAALCRQARQLGFPLFVKAVAGGGGKGMRLVSEEKDLFEALSAAQREALAAFGDGKVFLEKSLAHPRHIEVQILGDASGRIIHLGERECSVQRRHQKIVEETPSPALTTALGKDIAAAALAVARAVGYTNAGTVEFLVEKGGQFYFLEINPRLQVEHPVTEWVTGIDLVREQIRLAGGEGLAFRQNHIQPRGHAMECRIYAEDPANNFFPSPGKILFLAEPCGPGIRIDSGVVRDAEIPVHYDPLIAKVSAWGRDRESARRRMINALREYALIGPVTNVEFLRDLLDHPAFVTADLHTGFLAQHFLHWRREGRGDRETAAVVAALSTMPSSSPGLPSAPPTPWQSVGRWRVGSEPPEST